MSIAIKSLSTSNHINNPSKNSTFLWKISSENDFDNDIFDLKKTELSGLTSLFIQSKNKKRVTENNKYSINYSLKTITANKSKKRKINSIDMMAPVMDTEFDTLSSYSDTDEYSENYIYKSRYNYFYHNINDDTEDEEISDLGMAVSYKGKEFYIPKNIESIKIFDPINDGFDVIPELLEFLPSDDPANKISRLIKLKNFGSLKSPSTTYKNLKKRTPYSFAVNVEDHILNNDKVYILDKNLSKSELHKRKTIQNSSRKLAWSAIVSSIIRTSHISFETWLNNKTYKLKCIAEKAVTEVKKRYKRFVLKNGDVYSRARKCVFEMQNYWRKIDRDFEESKRKRRKDIETARRQFENARDAKRQRQRLDFLLKQTEIYSNFMGLKMGIAFREESKPNIFMNVEGFIGPPNSKNLVEEEKASQAAIDYMNRRKMETNVYEQEMALDAGMSVSNSALLTDFNTENQQIKSSIKEPKMFRGQLKTYQKKGLNWLVNLYDQCINGILADEMGLGKTIQSIAFIAYLCETRDLWGPYLIIAPNTVVHNWCSELNQFTPALKVLPYWGIAKYRDILRKFWNPRSLYCQDGEFHILVTSYSTFQADERYFRKIRWQFIILDEAHAIKNCNSRRWKSLLSLKCRNRLLLTGTPIQNSMAELWALLHYIMPTLFEKHNEFKEWFSKNIESQTESRKEKMSDLHLKRLHTILKPFMLRRIKKDVENEMAPKNEIIIGCELTARQKEIYNSLKTKFCNQLKESSSNFDKNIFNAVMQFRKVCNHPDLLSKKTISSSLIFQTLNDYNTIFPSSFNDQVNIDLINQNPIHFNYPRKLYFSDLKLKNQRKHILKQFFIFSVLNMKISNAFSFSRFCDLSLNEIEFFASNTYILRALFIFYKIHHYNRLFNNNITLTFENLNKLIFLILPLILSNSPLIKLNHYDFSTYKYFLMNLIPKCSSSPQVFNVSSYHNTISQESKYYNTSTWEKRFLCLHTFGDTKNTLITEVSTRKFCIPHNLGILNNIHQGNITYSDLCDLEKEDCYHKFKAGKIHVPDKKDLINDCGKMRMLDHLLLKKKGKHRILIFSQMTKMLNILEDYCDYRNFKYLRLDGSTAVADRTLMVREFQTNPDIFIFLLSTRAGGLGINLTSADTVIFYDNDWNPTMDAQAMDRVHRIGQTKQVTIYRIICQKTVEERVWRIAQSKFKIQKSVYSGGFKFSKNKDMKKDSDIFRFNELKDFILNG